MRQHGRITGEWMNLDLSGPERDLLLEVLESELGRVKGEIYKTETWDYKEQLKSRETMLGSLIERLGAPEIG
jgi:hypothetical protein